jgi:alkanesulfonate monooxygenase SsuD/methylene tetrahydromethanopterin reductase-like flavin-dependent oxidoreductase (luciferase family)
MIESSLSTSDSPTFFSNNALKLGIFCLNVSGGMMMSTAAKAHLDWDESVAVAQVADQTGWDFLLPIGRWRGQGGKFNVNAEQYECFTWAAAIAEVTKRIQVFATCHVPIFHPMLAAKLSSTIDNISGGRFGLNIVSGWNEAEFGMFGIAQLEHDDRYRAASEWLEIVERLWTDVEEFDHDGSFYQLKNAYLQPKPVQKRPVIVSAGTSSAGLDFAINQSDYCFIGGQELSLVEDTLQRSQARAQELGQTFNALTFGSVVVRDTEAEAKRYFEWYVDELGDIEAATALVGRVVSGGAQSMPPELILSHARAFIAGWGSLPLVGTAEQVADKLIQIHQTGIAGMGLGWLDYTEGLAQFNAEVMPLLREAGLRVA